MITTLNLPDELYGNWRKQNPEKTLKGFVVLKMKEDLGAESDENSE